MCSRTSRWLEIQIAYSVYEHTHIYIYYMCILYDRAPVFRRTTTAQSVFLSYFFFYFPDTYDHAHTRSKVFFPVFFFYVCIKSTTTTTDNDAQTHGVLLLLLLLFAYYIILYMYIFAGVNRWCGGNAICVCPVLVRKPCSLRYRVSECFSRQP